MAAFIRRHQSALEYILCERESAVGWRSSWDSQVTRLLRLRTSRRPEELLPLEAFVDRTTGYDRRRALHAYRALKRMDGRPGGRLLVVVLHRAFGPRCPGSNFAELGPLAALVPYTPSVRELVDGHAFRDAADVIRSKLAMAAHPREHEPKEDFERRRKYVRSKRSQFIARARVEAAALLSEAKDAFAAAYDAEEAASA